MSKLPEDLKYTKSHEWVRTLPDGTLEIGITDHAQHALGDLVFVEVPEAVNTDAYGAGWLMRLKPAAGALAAAELLSAVDYQKVLDAEGG